MDDFATMNEAWDEVFTWQPKPVCVDYPSSYPLFQNQGYLISLWVDR